MTVPERFPLIPLAIIGTVIAATIAVFALRMRRPAVTNSLAPNPSAVRYRFDLPPSQDARKDLDDAIAAGEAPNNTTDPLEMTELANLYLVRAQLSGDRRDYQVAEQLAQRSLVLLPSPSGATITLAKLANARHEFTRAIEIARGYHGRNATAVPMVLATAYLALGDLPHAAEAADTAVRTKPTPTTYLERALVYQAWGRDTESAADFANAVRVEDYGDVLESARVRALWSRFLVRRGVYAGARLVIDEALRIAPGNALALAVRAELALRTGDPKHARDDLEQAFVTSRQLRYLIDETRAIALSGDRANANTLLDQLERLVRDELEQGGLGHRLELVEVLVDRGKPAAFAEAVTVARDELTRRPAAETRFQLARALAWTGEYDEADTQLQAAFASGAREPQYYELAARLALRHGDLPRAKRYEELADSVDPVRGPWRSLGLP